MNVTFILIGRDCSFRLYLSYNMRKFEKSTSGRKVERDRLARLDPPYFQTNRYSHFGKYFPGRTFHK